MSLKFGSMFDELLGKGKSADTSGFEAASASLKAANDRALVLADAVRDADRAWRASGQTVAEIAAARVVLTQAEDAAKAQTKLLAEETQKLAKAEEGLIDVQVKGYAGANKYKKSIAEVNSQFESDIKKLTDAFKESDMGAVAKKKYEDDVEALKRAKAQAKAMSVVGSIADGPEAAMKAVGDVIDDAVATMGPEAELAWKVVKNTIGAAIKQTFELNDSLKNLERQTGGFVTASKLGYDAFGNSTQGFVSLKTAAINANVSIEEFSESVKSLVDDSFGATLGGVKIAKGELQEFGVEAAKMKKYYGADIGPTVRRLYQDYGMSVQDSTKLVEEASNKALVMGLNVAGFVKHFQQVVDLVGDVYFETTDQMRKMATIASQLGVSVASMAKGLVKMGGITDLFQQQQLTANMGLHEEAKALGMVYALRAQGKVGEANQMEFAALAKDVLAAGQVDSKTGDITQMGLDVLEKGAGLDKEQRAGVQRLIKESKTLGWSLSKLGDEAELTVAEQKKLAKLREDQMTATEKLSRSWEKIKQAVIDPLANALVPLIDVITEVIESLSKIARAFKIGASWIDYMTSVDDREKKKAVYDKQEFEAASALAAGGRVFNEVWDKSKDDLIADLKPLSERLEKASYWEIFTGGAGLGYVKKAWGWLANSSEDMAEGFDKTTKSMNDLKESLPGTKGKGAPIDWNNVLEISDTDVKNLMKTPTVPSAVATMKANAAKTVNTTTTNNTSNSETVAATQTPVKVSIQNNMAFNLMDPQLHKSYS